MVLNFKSHMTGQNYDVVVLRHVPKGVALMDAGQNNPSYPQVPSTGIVFLLPRPHVLHN